MCQIDREKLYKSQSAKVLLIMHATSRGSLVLCNITKCVVVALFYCPGLYEERSCPVV